MQTATITEQELDRLENLLYSDVFGGETMPLDTLQGFLCAVISGPETIPPGEWMPHVFGEVEYDTLEQGKEIAALLLKLSNSIATALSNEEDFDLILYGLEDNPEELDFASWSDGYVYGSQISGTDWFEAAGEFAHDLSEKMEVFFLLNGMLKEDTLKSNEPWLSAKEEKKLLAQAQNDMPETVGAIYRFWRNMSIPISTVRRDSPKVGRNDPCPCGSGKKFKQCCGEKPTLH
jgi:uncharacterized protein